MANTTAWGAMGFVPNDAAQADPAGSTFYNAMGLWGPEVAAPVPPTPPSPPTPPPTPPVVTVSAEGGSRINMFNGIGIGF